MSLLYTTSNDSFLDLLSNFSVTLPDVTTQSPGNESTSCAGQWQEANHALYHVSNVAVLAGLAAPSTSPKSLLVLHGTCVIGFLMLSSWSWAMMCALDMFSWNFLICLINVMQLCYIGYHIRPVRFSPELEEVYDVLFAPLKVTRSQFRKFAAPERSSLATLHEGEPYATQEVTKTDRLGLLVSGTVHVVCSGQLLHPIEKNQFLDSPEFESSTRSEDKFHVSIVAATSCRYICWQRQQLQYLFAKEPYIALILGHVLGRDIVNKLYLLNQRLKTQRGSHVDIRLPNVSSAAMSGIDLWTDENNTQRTINIPSDVEDMEDEDMLEEVSEKMPMFPNGVPHAKLQLQLSNSTYSSASSR